MSKILLTLICIFPLLLTNCAKQGTVEGNSPIESFSATDFKNIPLGAKEETPERLAGMQVFSSMVPFGVLPRSVDISHKMPPAGNQGSQGSCVGWATAYAYKTFQEGLEENWALDITPHQFSPAWIYNQINGGNDNGAFVSDAMALMQEKGVDTLVHFPYNASDYTTQPQAASFSRALRYKLTSWSIVPQNDLDTIKQQLAQGKAVVFRVGIYDDFYQVSPSDPVYDQKGETYRGGHAMAIVGYDDDKIDSQGYAGAFKFINSWGQSWGTYQDDQDTSKGKGYGWISYRFANYELAAGFQAFISEDAQNYADTTPPSITIKNPLAGATVNGIQDIQADVYDNERVVQVDFYLNGTLLGSDNSPYIKSLQAYTQVWDTATAGEGAYVIEVRAIDARGNQSAAQITVNRQNFVCKEYTATNFQHVAAGRAEVYTKYYSKYAKTKGSGEDLGSYGSTFYSPSTKVAEKTPGYFIKGSCPSAPPVDTISPQVSVTGPTNGSTVSGNITLSATATDNIGVTKVEFYISTDGVGSTKACEDVSSPYSCVFDTRTIPDGTRSIRAYAYDAAGNRGMEENTVITVRNNDPVVDNEAPAISITSPEPGSTARDNLSLSVTATDNVGVTKVEYFLNDNKICESIASPFSCLLDTKVHGNGSYALKAKAHDAVGNNTLSTPVTFQIDNSSFVCKNFTSTNMEHIAAGRAFAGGLMNYYAYTLGANHDLGLVGSTYYSAITTVRETASGYFEKGSCP